MALHYFHMTDGEKTLDREGTDLLDAASVRWENGAIRPRIQAMLVTRTPQ